MIWQHSQDLWWRRSLKNIWNKADKTDSETKHKRQLHFRWGSLRRVKVEIFPDLVTTFSHLLWSTKTMLKISLLSLMKCFCLVTSVPTSHLDVTERQTWVLTPWGWNFSSSSVVCLFVILMLCVCVFVCSRGDTALHKAATSCQRSICHFLVDAGASLMKTDLQVNSPRIHTHTHVHLYVCMCIYTQKHNNNPGHSHGV